MRQCSACLFMSVIVSIMLGFLEFKVHAWVWVILWSAAIICRLGVGHTVVRSSYLNTTGRKKRNTIMPAAPRTFRKKMPHKNAAKHEQSPKKKEEEEEEFYDGFD